MAGHYHSIAKGMPDQILPIMRSKPLDLHSITQSILDTPRREFQTCGKSVLIA